MLKHCNRISLGFCVAMLLAGGSVASLTFARPPKNGGGGNANYAFVHIVIDKGGLFLTTIDGADTFQLTRPNGNFSEDRNPSWSPDLDPETDGDQTQIAYLNRNGNEDWNLYVINPDGSGNRLVRSFVSSEPRPEDRSTEAVLVWSPNGKEILFSDYDTSDARSDTDTGIYAVEIATGNVRTLLGRQFLDGISVAPVRPSVSPLGLLAFEFLGDIYAVEFLLDENGLIQVDPQAEWATITAGATRDEYPVWSPDGTYLGYMRTDTSVDPYVTQLIVYDVLLNEFIAVLEVADAQQVTWSPDGSEIGFVDGSVTANGREITSDIYRIINWEDPDLRQFIRVTLSDRVHEVQPHWNPGWVRP